uniref:Uncharacterized protein n=1 Tax=Spongospora subterranea TaxID=70186 RepID=A0A0H5RCS9_9EUKA|eukprot:CRZ06304.1 hypothetical protein [Spongospora subterranea]
MSNVSTQPEVKILSLPPVARIQPTIQQTISNTLNFEATSHCPDMYIFVTPKFYNYNHLLTSTVSSLLKHMLGPRAFLHQGNRILYSPNHLIYQIGGSSIFLP